MKTNASPKTIVQAVENVSKRQYEGNIVFRRTPERMTKNVYRFTLKTLDANKKGSLVTKQGVKQTKANWDAHQDVMKEILRLDPRPHIYVDTVYGREHNKSTSQHVTMSNIESGEEESAVVESTKEQGDQDYSGTRKKRRSKVSGAVSDVENNTKVMNIVKAIKYILQNPHVLND